MGAVFDENSHFERRIKAFEYATGNVDTCQYTFFLDQKMLASHCVGADSTESGVVAVAYIFGKRQIDQIIDKLLFGFHIL